MVKVVQLHLLERFLKMKITNEMRLTAAIKAEMNKSSSEEKASKERTKFEIESGPSKNCVTRRSCVMIGFRHNCKANSEASLLRDLRSHRNAPMTCVVKLRPVISSPPNRTIATTIATRPADNSTSKRALCRSTNCLGGDRLGKSIGRSSCATFFGRTIMPTVESADGFVIMVRDNT